MNNNDNSMPLVSVILPSYNHELFIEECIRSVANQTYANLEVIILDDGSKDRTREVIKNLLAELKDPRIQFIEQDNIGPSQTINKGIRLSRGNLITILNTDDAFYPNRIEELVSSWTKTKADFTFTKVKYVDQNGHALDSSHPNKKWYDKALYKIKVEPSIGFVLLEDNCAITTGNFFFTRELFEKLGGFIEKRVAHDLDFILRATLFTEPQFIDSELMIYRLHGKNDIIRSAHLIEPEVESIVSNFFLLQFTQTSQNKLAATEENWPSYFRSYIHNIGKARLYQQSFYSLLAGKKSSQNTKAENALQVLGGDQKPITLVTHDLSLSGAPALVYELAVQLSKNGFSPKIFSRKIGPLLDTILAAGIPFKRIWFSNWIEKSSYIKTAAALILCTLRNLLSLRGNIILNSIANWPLLVPLYLNPTVKKIYFYIHEDFSLDSVLRNGPARKLVKHILLSSKVELWFGSEFTRRIWKDSGFDGKVHYFSGFDAIETKPKTISSNRPIKFLFVGTFCARKGLPYLISVFEDIARTTEARFELSIVGINDEIMDTFTLDLVKKVYRHNLVNPNEINLYPQVSPQELNPHYEESDVYITTSLSECLPLAILNAMRHGLPVVTTDVGGCAEAIEKSKSGFIVPPRNFNCLKDAILFYCDNRDEIRSMGLNAATTFKKKFDNKVTITSFTEILENT